MRKTGAFTLVLLVLLVMANCKKEQSGSAQEVPGNSSDAVALKQETTDSADSEAKAPDEGRPHIAFDEKDFDFGEVETGEKVEHLFPFRNTGNGILKINKVRSS